MSINTLHKGDDDDDDDDDNNNNNCYYYYYYFVLILNQIISTHSIPTYVIKILFNIIFPLTL